MSRWMKMSLSLGVAWALLCCTTIKADPPETETAAITAPPAPQATSILFQDASVPQVQIDVVIYAVDLAKQSDDSKTPVAELLKRSGFKFLDASEQPQRAGAVRTEPLVLDLIQTEFGSACTELSRPVVRTQVWSEATVTVGETQVAGQLGGSGTRLTVLPLLDSNGLIVMHVRLENATYDDATDAEGTGTDAASITTQVVSLIAELQAGQQLLVANGTSESKLTRFVQLTPRIVAENAAVNEVHNVRYQVRVFEIDHKTWSNAGDTSKRRQAFDDVLTPLAQGWHGHKLASGSIQAWATRDSVSDAEIASLQPALRQISSREFAIDDGEMAMFDYGGRSPQILMMERPQSGSLRSNYDGTHIQPLATTLAAESQVADTGRIRLSVYYDSDRFLRRIQTSMDELKKNGSKVTAELSVGQTLCLCDVIPESSTISDGLLITLTPVEIRVQERTEKHPALVAKTAAPVEQTFVVEDRWPIGEIRVGQRVIPVPLRSSTMAW